MTNSNSILDKLPPNLQVIWANSSPIPTPLHEKVDATSGQGFDVNRWGSCQYASALSMFDCIQKLSAYLTEEEIWSLMEIQFTLGEPNQDGHQCLVTKHQTMTGLDQGRSQLSSEFDREYFDFCQSINQELDEATDVNEYFEILKGCQDLWTAMAVVFDSIYPDSNFPYRPIPGHGPALNQRMQSDNLTIGLQAWLLFNRGWVTDPDTTYEGFDT